MLVLRDGLGEHMGAATCFIPPSGWTRCRMGSRTDDGDVEASQADIDERLQSEFEDFERGGEALGVLWIAVDQGQELRKTHGAAACQAMVDKVRRALAAGLRPAEELGRWGDDEFLVIAHERTAEMLASHARTLAGLARTADFRWWGDRLSLTVSIGAAQAEAGRSVDRVAEARAPGHGSQWARGRQPGQLAHKARMEAMEHGVRSGLSGGRA